MLCCGIKLETKQVKVDGEQLVGMEGGSDTELC